MKRYHTNISDSSCSCPSFLINQIPCKHIFATRKHSNLPLFDPTMIHKRWLKTTITNELPVEGIYQTNLTYNYHIGTNISSSIPKGTNKAANYNEIFRFTQELAQTILTGTEEQARDKFEILKMIKEMWESHIQFYVKPISNDENNEEYN